MEGNSNISSTVSAALLESLTVYVEFFQSVLHVYQLLFYMFFFNLVLSWVSSSVLSSTSLNLSLSPPDLGSSFPIDLLNQLYFKFLRCLVAVFQGYLFYFISSIFEKTISCPLFRIYFIYLLENPKKLSLKSFSVCCIIFHFTFGEFMFLHVF